MTKQRQNMAREADIFLSLNDPEGVFKDPVQLQFMRTLVDLMRRGLTNVVKTDRAVPGVIMQSPNGTSWIVEVDDTGKVSARRAR